METNQPNQPQIQSNGITPTTVPKDGNKLEQTDEENKIILTKKFEDWVHYFTTHGVSFKRKKKIPIKKDEFVEWVEKEIEEETYGNKTFSAIVAYGLDPVKQYQSAAVIGYENFKKLKGFASMHLERQGFTVDKLIDIAANRAVTTENKAWWDEVAILSDIKQPPGTPMMVQNNTQINNVDINAPEAIDFNKKFKKFLEAEA